MDSIRQRLYAPLYERHKSYPLVGQLQHAAGLLEVNWLELSADSSLVGKTIEAASVRTRTGASIVAVLHNGELVPNPERTYRFAAGDQVAVMGDAEQLANFQTLV